MSRRLRPNVGTLVSERPYGVNQLPRLLNVETAANSVGYVLAGNPATYFPYAFGVTGATDVQLFDLPRTWVQTLGKPAVVSFEGPDDYIEGRVYLRDCGTTSAISAWKTGGTTNTPPDWDVPAGKVEYKGRLYDICLAIRQFTGGTPTVLASKSVPAATFADNWLEIWQIAGQLFYSTTLTLSVMPSHNLENSKVVLTAMTERTRASTSQPFLMTYWLAAVEASANLNTPTGLAGHCEYDYRKPSDQATHDFYAPNDSQGFGPGVAFCSRLTSLADCPSLVPFSAKTATDMAADAVGHTGPADSLVPVVSSALQLRDDMWTSYYDNDEPDSLPDATRWEVITPEYIPSNSDFYSSPYLNSGGFTQNGSPAGKGYFLRRNYSALYSKDALKSHRKAFNVVGTAASASCASWSDADEPPPTTLNVAADYGSTYSNATTYWRQWLPASIAFTRLTCGMDSVYTAQVNHTTTRDVSGYTNETQTLNVTGQVLLLFSAACDPFIYSDGPWKHKHAKASVCDAFISLRFEAEASAHTNPAVTVVQQWAKGSLKVYGSGLNPGDGAYLTLLNGVNGFGRGQLTPAIYTARWLSSTSSFSLQSLQSGSTLASYVYNNFAPLTLSYVSES